MLLRARADREPVRGSVATAPGLPPHRGVLGVNEKNWLVLQTDRQTIPTWGTVEVQPGGSRRSRNVVVSASEEGAPSAGEPIVISDVPARETRGDRLLRTLRETGGARDLLRRAGVEFDEPPPRR